MRPKPAVTLCLSLVAVIAAAGAVESAKLDKRIEKRTLEAESGTRSYYLFVPAAAAEREPLPLVLLFHGSGRNGLSLVEKWNELAEEEGILVAGLNSLDPAVWVTGKDGPDALRSLVDALAGEIPVDRRRVYLFGHSGGAGFALEVGLLESEYFAAVAFHAGALRPEGRALIDRAARKIPIALLVGTRDPLYPLSVVRATLDVLTAKGIPVQLTEIPRHDHWYYDRAPAINRKAWEWLAGHALDGEPVYREYQFLSRAPGGTRALDSLPGGHSADARPWHGW